MRHLGKWLVGLAGCGLVAVVVVWAMSWLSAPAGAQVGGYAQVTRLELEFTPADQSVKARFYFASGVTLTEDVRSKAVADRLYDAAKIMASDHARLFATAQEDRVVSWRVSVP